MTCEKIAIVNEIALCEVFVKLLTMSYLSMMHNGHWTQIQTDMGAVYHRKQRNPVWPLHSTYDKEA